MRLILATRNAHKVDEVTRILANEDIHLLTLDDYPDLPLELQEDGSTFEANALQKAQFIYNATGILACADDSGLEVDALDGQPGVQSKRFSEQATDSANNALLLERLQGRDDRTARYKCVLALVGNGLQVTASGACEGSIGHELIGTNGFGYDPLFRPQDAPGRSMAELSLAEKNAISHRGRAFKQLPDLLQLFQLYA